MSQRVVIDYNGLSIETKARCDAALHSLCKINKSLELLEQNSSKLIDTQVKEYEEYLLKSKEQLSQKIEALKDSMNEYSGIAREEAYEENSRYAKYQELKSSILKQVYELSLLANDLTGTKLEVINSLITDNLVKFSKEVMDRAHGKMTIPNDIRAYIDGISDIDLREITYITYIKNASKNPSVDELKDLAKIAYDELVLGITHKVVEEYKQDLKAKAIDSSVLDKATSIDEAAKITSDAIASEEVRKETIKIITKAIKPRGFIVNSKNIKINRETNVVKFVALKANGQKAEFEVHLNGKFMYHFENYEGSACKKDIEPFLEDLRNVYDINILHKEIIEENPDKIMMQKYQQVNKNKGTN